MLEENIHKDFFWVQGTFVAYETSAGLFPTDYLRPEFVACASSKLRSASSSSRRTGGAGVVVGFFSIANHECF